MTFKPECFVYIVLPGTTEFVTAARFEITLDKNEYPVGKLIYAKNYLTLSNAVELDPIDLRFGEQEYVTQRMNGYFGAIRDSMPDFWGRRVIQNYLGNRPVDEFEFLLLGPDDRAGALGFGLGSEPPAPRKKFNRTLDLAFLQEMAEAIIKDDPIVDAVDQKHVKKLLLEGTSMGGARPKAVVEDKDSLWIAKFSTPSDRWNQPKVEHAMLNLAKICDLNVADSKLTTVAGKDVLLVRRFDRDKLGDSYRRHRMVSALTLLQSEESPLARESWSYLILADEIRRTSAEPKADLRELFMRMCFNALISNLDDHPRNHAILAKDANWRLSPAYDLTPSPTISQDNRALAMTCGLYGRGARKENLISSHEHFLLSKEEAENLVNQMVETVKNEWDACLRKAGVSDADCTRISSALLYEGFFYKGSN